MQRKKAKHTPSFYSLFTSCSFDATKNKFDCYKSEDCMERFCKNVREHAMKVVNYEKEEMMLLTDEEYNSHEKQNVCYICKKEFSNNDDDDDDDDNDKKYHYTGKFRGVTYSICNLRYKTPKEIPLVFHNGSTYDYHSTINQLAKEFDGQLKCLRENTEKYITSSVPIKKQLDNGKAITYKLKSIDSFRFMSTSLSKLVKYLSGRLLSDTFTDCKSKLDYTSFKDDQLIFRYFDCKNNYKKSL